MVNNNHYMEKNKMNIEQIKNELKKEEYSRWYDKYCEEF